MQRDPNQPRDAGTLGDAQRARRRGDDDARQPGETQDKSDRMEHAEIRQNPPGERDDLNPDNSQGFTGEIGDRKQQFPGSEAARRKVSPTDDNSRRIPHQRETAEMSPDDFDSEDTID